MAEKLTEKLLIYIIKEQHGFVKGRSTLTNLLIYNNYISKILAKYNQVDSVYLDFAKAFDSVNHSLLIFKLSRMGLRGVTLRWLISYLSKRELQVQKGSRL